MDKVPRVTISSFPMQDSPQLAAGGSSSSGGRKRKKVHLAPGRSQMDWMRRAQSGEDLAGSGGVMRKITLAEVARHATEDDAWMVVSGCVYNITPYIDYHPGGRDQLLRGAGRDATELFFQVHPWVNIQAMLRPCILGLLSSDPADTAPLPPPPAPSSSPDPAPASSAPVFAPWTLAARRPVSHNSAVFCFTPPPGEYTPVPLGAHVYARTGDVVRPYTPINGGGAPAAVSEGGITLELLVKRYDGGPMSSHIHSLAEGDTLELSGPHLPSDFAWRPDDWSHVTFIAAGTGLAPMVRLLHATVADASIEGVHLIFANSTPADVLLADSLAALQDDAPFALDFLVSTAADSHPAYAPAAYVAQAGVGAIAGRLTSDRLAALLLAPPSAAHKLFVCGPSSFNAAVSAWLIDDIGHAPDAICRFAPTPLTAALDDAPLAAPDDLPFYTADDVAEHNSAGDAWMIINNFVYDATPFIDEHPGGRVILDGAGRDATTLFHNAYHSPYAKRLLDRFVVGRLAHAT